LKATALILWKLKKFLPVIVTVFIFYLAPMPVVLMVAVAWLLFFIAHLAIQTNLDYRRNK